MHVLPSDEWKCASATFSPSTTTTLAAFTSITTLASTTTPHMDDETSFGDDKKPTKPLKMQRTSSLFERLDCSVALQYELSLPNSGKKLSFAKGGKFITLFVFKSMRPTKVR